METLLITNTSFPDDRSQQGFRSGWVYIHGSTISAIGTDDPPRADRVIDATGMIVLPGFVDVHTHGGGGIDVMTASAAELVKLSEFYATRGVTSYLAATVTAPSEDISSVIDLVADAMSSPANGARILGIHLEGPYISKQAKGAQREEYIRPSSKDEYVNWLKRANVKLITIAPEIPGNLDCIRDFVSHGITVSIGHSDATYEQAMEAISLGASQATHTFNGMKGLHHREPGTAGAVISSSGVVCELIADNIHIHPAVLSIVVRAKGTQGVCLVTDSMAAAGLSDGEYKLARHTVTVQDGAVTNEHGSLAGSVLTMDRALKNIMDATGLSVWEAWPMSSANAIRQLGLDKQKGKIQTGYDADIVMLNKEFNVHLTLTEGNIVYER